MVEPFWGVFREMLDDPASSAEEVEPYHSISALLYDQMSVHDWDEAEYVELAERLGGGVLELCCGTGRILLRLAQSGRRVVGIDRSQPMLDVLRTRLTSLSEEARQRISVLHADVSDFALQEDFSLIILPYLSIGLLESRDSRERTVCNAARHLTPNGMLVFDHLTPPGGSAPWLAGEVVQRTFTLEGREIPTRFGVRFDPQARAMIGNTCWEVDVVGHRMKRYCESKILHVMDNAEVDDLVQKAGLVIIDRRCETLGDGRTQRNIVQCRQRMTHEYPLWHPYMPAPQASPPLTLSSGVGCEVTDTEGRSYIDASGGLWSVACGLGRPEIIQAITNQLERLSFAPLFLGHASPPALELSRRLAQLAPAPLEWVYLTGSGSESIELSIKLARSFFSAQGRNDKKGILYLDASYHGTFFGSMGVSGLVPEAEAFSPLLPGLCALPTPDPDRRPVGMEPEAFAASCAAIVESVLKGAGDRIAALVIEPILASAGVITPSRSYFQAVQQACRRHGVLVIVDEVATGFGRTGDWLACGQAGLRPDILCLGKGISSGYLPLGAVLFSAHVGSVLSQSGTPLAHGSTHNGNPACCAAALATLDVMEKEDLPGRSRAAGQFFLDQLGTLTGLPGLGKIRGTGLMLYVGLVDASGRPANQSRVFDVHHSLRRLGVLTYIAADGLILCPALTIRDDQIKKIVSSLEAVLNGDRSASGDPLVATHKSVPATCAR